MNLPAYVRAALNMLKANGFEAYAVGGCVRDMLLKIPPSDYDITTNALPQQIEQVFSGCNIFKTGIAHGTVTVILENNPLEITTYRCDGVYTDNRRPDYVTFTKSLQEDLKRRDFTVNALCYNEQEGLVDMFNGAEDIKNKLIRAVGEPKKRFEEDSLRILRALRFASVYGFEIEKSTRDAILEYKYLIKNVAAERIAVEMNKLLCGKNVYTVLMDFYPVFLEIYPEFNGAKGFLQHSKYHIYDIWEHTATAVGSVCEDKICRLAMLFHDIGKIYTFSMDENGEGHFYNHANISEKTAQSILERYKYDNATKDKVLQLIKYHDLVVENNESQIKRLLLKLGEEQFFRLMEIKRADTLAQSEAVKYRLEIINEIIFTAKEILKNQQCFSLKNLAVNGNDLIALGLKGREIGNTLNLLLEKVISNELNNIKQDLLGYVKDLH